jgi:hypothetical protein
LFTQCEKNWKEQSKRIIMTKLILEIETNNPKKIQRAINCLPCMTGGGIISFI